MYSTLIYCHSLNKYTLTVKSKRKTGKSGFMKVTWVLLPLLKGLATFLVLCDTQYRGEVTTRLFKISKYKKL